MTPSARADANRVGILAMIGAMACFVVNDSLVKFASERLPPGQLIFSRGVMATALVLVVAALMGETARIRAIANGWVVTRAVIDAFATVLFLLSLFHLPISIATAIYMASPLIITVLAAVSLGDRIGMPSWLASAAGFVGVLLIIQPQSEAFSAYAVLCLFATVLLSFRDLVTQRLPDAVPSIVVTLSTTVAVTALAGVLSLFESWEAMRTQDLGVLAVAAAFLASAYFLLVTGTRRGDLSLITPFRYTALLFAVLAGFVVWGETPNPLAWCGIVLVVGAGIALLRVNRQARASGPPLD